jgi:peptidoglycan-N-acetylglucosamine deacetylase
MKKVLLISITVLLSFVLMTAILHFRYNKPPHRALFLTPLCHLSTNEKIVALTFDDGPSLWRTPPLLDLLDKHQVKATFFMTGAAMERNFHIVEQVVERGHLIANHSQNHKRLIFKFPDEIEYEIDKTDSLIRLTGTDGLKYFRPPHGDKMIVLPYLLKKKEKILVNFDVGCPSQYHSPLNPDKVADEALNGARPGSIIVLHDGWDREVDAFIESVEKIIVGLKQKGYRFVRIDDKRHEMHEATSDY